MLKSESRQAIIKVFEIGKALDNLFLFSTLSRDEMALFSFPQSVHILSTGKVLIK